MTNRIRRLVHHFEVLYTLDPFVAVRAHYQHFPQVEDQEVLLRLKASQQQFPEDTPRSYPSLRDST